MVCTSTEGGKEQDCMTTAWCSTEVKFYVKVLCLQSNISWLLQYRYSPCLLWSCQLFIHSWLHSGGSNCPCGFTLVCALLETMNIWLLMETHGYSVHALNYIWWPEDLDITHACMVLMANDPCTSRVEIPRVIQCYEQLFPRLALPFRCFVPISKLNGIPPTSSSCCQPTSN